MSNYENVAANMRLFLPARNLLSNLKPRDPYQSIVLKEMVPRSFIMHSQERSTGSSLPIIVTSDDPISMKPFESQQTLFIPHEPTRDVKLTRYEHRERMLQCRIERIKRHPVKEEYWKKLQKREEALKVQEAFLQKQAGEENRVKGLSSKSRIRCVNRRRRLKYSTKQQPKLELTQEAGYFDESSEEIVNAIGMLQRRRSDRTRDEKSRAGIAKRARTRLSYGMEAKNAMVAGWQQAPAGNKDRLAITTGWQQGPAGNKHRLATSTGWQ
jgi:hypothetical protein